MEKSFWLESWEKDQIPFHKLEVNQHLQDFFPLFDLSKGEEVFVPLCGKSLDLLWLKSQQIKVVGNELSKLAIDSFTKENKIKWKKETRGNFEVLTDGELKIYQGDFFSLTPKQLSNVKAVYDRGSYVALPPLMRKKYAEHLKRITPKGTPILLVSYNFEEKEPGKIGPPFSSTLEDIKTLFGDQFLIDLLKREQNTNLSPRLVEAGLKETWSEIYFLRSL